MSPHLIDLSINRMTTYISGVGIIAPDFDPHMLERDLEYPVEVSDQDDHPHVLIPAIGVTIQAIRHQSLITTVFPDQSGIEQAFSNTADIIDRAFNHTKPDHTNMLRDMKAPFDLEDTPEHRNEFPFDRGMMSLTVDLECDLYPPLPALEPSKSGTKYRFDIDEFDFKLLQQIQWSSWTRYSDEDPIQVKINGALPFMLGGWPLPAYLVSIYQHNLSAGKAWLFSQYANDTP